MIEINDLLYEDILGALRMSRVRLFHALIQKREKVFENLIDQAVKGGYRPPKAKFMRPPGFGQFWGADSEYRCYTGNIRELQPRFGD